jgi:hypothetical protein
MIVLRVLSLCRYFFLQTKYSRDSRINIDATDSCEASNNSVAKNDSNNVNNSSNAGSSSVPAEFCRDSRKIFQMAKLYSAYAQCKLNLSPLILGIS